jgi:ribosome recycling factor
MAYNFSPFKDNLKRVEEWFKKELSSIRTGRATPAVLDSVEVEAYGAKMKLNQVAGISVEDAKTLRVSPYDQSQIKAVEKAIVQADIGLGVAVDDKGVRLMFPELTSERRTSFVKMVKDKLEEARIRLRGARDEVWKDIQNKEKEGSLREDEKFRMKEEMEKVAESSQKNMLVEFERKEKEILGG